MGHQPSLSDLACALLRKASLPFSFSPATAAVFERTGDEPWTLATVLAPE